MEQEEENIVVHSNISFPLDLWVELEKWSIKNRQSKSVLICELLAKKLKAKEK